MGVNRATLLVTEYHQADVTVVVPKGVLDQTTYADLRNHLLKSAAEGPAAVVVDLAALAVPHAAALSVFVAVATQVSHWPGVPIRLVAPPGRHGPLTENNPVRRFVTVHPTVAAAIADPTANPPRRVATVELPNSHAAMRAARVLVRTTCADWSLEWAADDAVLVINELVQNTIQHTVSAPTLRLELRRDLLTVAVRDDDPAFPPVAARSELDDDNAHGLDLVAGLAVAWGVTPTRQGGKVVWATLRGR